MLLNHIVCGREKQAEAMLKANPKLLLNATGVADDYSGRVFNSEETKKLSDYLNQEADKTLFEM